MIRPVPLSALLAAGLLSTALTAFVSPCAGQGSMTEGGPDVHDYVARARDATARYRDRDAAIADGYRPIGRDFPGMGEHWIHLGRLMSGAVVAERPQILSYATIEGAPTLVGVAYAVPVAAGEEPPDYPVSRDQWHYHSGTVAEESFIPRHMRESGDGQYRVAILHAWIWLENPDGTFQTNNWALPFARLGLEAPARVPLEAAKALSLLTGGDRYYADVAASCAGADEMSQGAAAAALERGRVAVSRWVQSFTPTAAAGDMDLSALISIWNDVWASLMRTTGCTG